VLPLIEWLLEKASPVKYNEQHVNKYTPNSLVKFLECAGFKICNVRTVFVGAPFVAGLSWKGAEAIHKLEVGANLRVGSLLLAEAAPCFDFN
jgi:hypothetical protein